MSRDLTANMVTEVTASQLSPIYLFDMTLPSGNIRLWTGIGDLIYDSNTYTGAANLISLAEIVETQSIEAQGVSITLNGLNSTILSTVFDNVSQLQRSTVDIYFAALDSNGALIADPYKIFTGIPDTTDISESGDTASITVNTESILIGLKRTKVRRYTPEDQKEEFAGDLFFDFIASMQDQEVSWGKGQ